MFMLSKFVFEAVYRPSGFLTIEPYALENFVSNFYYFRVGALVGPDEEVIPIDADLDIQPGQVVDMWSLEKFVLSDRVFALLGNTSSSLKKRRELLHSPSIDPGFSGSLRVSIRNYGDKPMTMSVGDTVGKAIFFDCSDSVINVEEFVKSKLKETQLGERDQAADEILKLYAEMKRRGNATP